ncbi:tetratricopeptide repeat-containing diguanylate cyclase [Chitinivorax sp. B]|uniref:tetratricopeptide repeat-containing diguanylate cyclase n=1 Tax=Chitinivorax sp. B TaxID=2502235 RepID=UPI0010F83E02|nr:tetratricopeptide repeat-containing diguanylate cyclase [Chitinivorax sp. B]
MSKSATPYRELFQQLKFQHNVEPAQACQLASEVHALAEQAHDLQACAEALYWRGMAQLSMCSLKAALTDFDHALGLARYVNALREQGLALRGLGLAHEQSANYETAVELLAQAYQCLDGSPAWIEEKLSVLHGMASTYLAIGRASEALKHYRELIAECEQRHWWRHLSITLSSLGICLDQLGELDAAESAFIRSGEVAIQHQLPGRDAVASLNLACFRIKHRGLRGNGLAALRDAILALQESGDLASALSGRVSLVEALMDCGHYEEANTELGWALEVAIETRSRRQELILYRHYAALSKVRGDFASAFNWFERYHELYRELEQESFDSRLSVLRIGFELDIARKEAELLRAQNEVLARSHADLAAANEELTRVSRELIQADQEKSRLVTEFRQLAITDSLTSLHNRRYLELRVADESALTRRGDHLVLIAVADVDHFKQINDRFGHPLGDDVLKAIAQVLRRQVANEHIAVRFGGEEFALLLFDVPFSTGVAICEQIRDCVAAYPWYELHPDLAVTLSIGLTQWPVSNAFQHALAAADQLLYQAKHQGRNRVVAELATQLS